jgi:hypothetical protein
MPPKNPTDLSLEILEKVDGFYSKSFEKLSNFYSESFSHLLTYGAGFGLFALSVLALFFEGKRRSLKKSEKRINDLKNHLENSLKESEKRNEEKFSQELKNFHSAFEQEKKNFELKLDKIAVGLKKDIKLSLLKSLFYQTTSQSNNNLKFMLLSEVLKICLELENCGEILTCSLYDLLDTMNKVDFKIDEEVNAAESLLEKLRQHDKKDNSLLSKVVSKLEDKIKKTKKS